MAGLPWLVSNDGVTLTVRLTPKGGRDGIDGFETLADGRTMLKARVRAAPSEGEANDALIRMLAKAVGVPPRAVSITGGATSRIKRIVIVGKPAEIVARLEKLSDAG